MSANLDTSCEVSSQVKVKDVMLLSYRLVLTSAGKLVGRWYCQLPATPQCLSGTILPKLSSLQVVFEKTLADVDSLSTNGISGILYPTAEWHRGWSACCIFCWLFASFSIFTSWELYLFQCEWLWFMFNITWLTSELHDEYFVITIFLKTLYRVVLTNEPSEL